MGDMNKYKFQIKYQYKIIQLANIKLEFYHLLVRHFLFVFEVMIK